MAVRREPMQYILSISRIVMTISAFSVWENILYLMNELSVQDDLRSSSLPSYQAWLKI